MLTQWRTGMAGSTGLDYGVLDYVMKMLGVKKKRRPDVFMCVRIMEAETVKLMAEERERRSKHG